MADFTKRTLTSSSGRTVSQLSAEVDNLGQNKLGDAYVDLGVNLAPLESGLALGLLALEGYFVHAYSKMETQMRNIWTIMSISEEQLAGIQDEILKMSREVPQTATQLAEGYYDIVSSGIEAKDAMKVLNVAAKAASAGLTSTETAKALDLLDRIAL